MRWIDRVLGVLMACTVAVVAVAAYGTEGHGDGKVEVYGTVEQRGEPFSTVQIMYAMDEGPTQFATMDVKTATFTTPKRRLTPGRDVTVFVRHAPSTTGGLANERRCRIYVDGRPVLTSEWLNRSSADICRWSI